MRTIAFCLAALLNLPAAASAQATVDIHFGLPVVLPPLVVVSPGVQVVPGVQEECFYHDGYYWVRRDGYWYRSHSHRGGWVMVPPRRVPTRLAGLPPGKYRNWHDERKAERREARREWREEHHDNGHGHGHGHDRD